MDYLNFVFHFQFYGTHISYHMLVISLLYNFCYIYLSPNMLVIHEEIFGKIFDKIFGKIFCKTFSG